MKAAISKRSKNPAAPYEPTLQERRAMDAHQARKSGEPTPPRLKVTQTQGGEKLEIDHPDKAFGQLSLLRALGTTNYNFLNGVIGQLVPLATFKQKVDQNTLNFILSIINGIKPTDETEAMLATQMAAVHLATLSLARQLDLSKTLDQQDSAERAFNKLARTFTMQMETLKRYRTGGQQQVRVEHVHVHAGAQAVVAVVKAPRGEGQRNSEDQPHAKQITHAPQPPVWGSDKVREPVPGASDEERPLPNARRQITRRSKGK